MKETKIKEEFKSMSELELKEKLEVLRRKRLNLAINSATAYVKDYSQFKKLRRGIARLLTYLQQKQKSVTKKK